MSQEAAACQARKLTFFAIVFCSVAPSAIQYALMHDIMLFAPHTAAEPAA
jgi:hypothetical protein